MSFSKQLQGWANSTQERVEAVHKRSCEMLGDEMIRTKANGGNLPVETGNLEKSQVASQEAMPKESEGPFNGSNLGAVVATMDISKPLYIGYTTAYAKRMNFGFVGADSKGRVYNQEGNHFIERAIAMWPQLVEAAIKDVKSNSKT